ncbi:MAG: helix-turn-helix transcriptional regulator [Alcanivorax sp.]
MDSALLVGRRLREERNRLKMNQTEFASAAGASKRTMVEWEKGTTSPSAVQLSALSECGVDVAYVITGERRENDNKNQLQERSALSGLIDTERMSRIVELLRAAANGAGRRWPEDQLWSTAMDVYNFLAQDSGAVDDNRIDQVLRLVVNR